MKVVYITSFLGASTAYGLSVGQVVSTSSGPVQGHAATVKNDVSAYLGIPYAEPPVGKLRFMPPKKYHGNSTINGSNIVSSFPLLNGKYSLLKYSPRDSLVLPSHISAPVATFSPTTMLAFPI